MLVQRKRKATTTRFVDQQVLGRKYELFYISAVAGDPTLIPLDQISLTAVRVTWSPPSGGATVTGYVVHYRTGSSVESKTEPSSSTSTDITDLTSGATYTISVEATSQHLSGKSEEMMITLRKCIS